MAVERSLTMLLGAPQHCGRACWRWHDQWILWQSEPAGHTVTLVEENDDKMTGRTQLPSSHFACSADATRTVAGTLSDTTHWPTLHMHQITCKHTLLMAGFYYAIKPSTAQ
jgi:hypothetical protein